MKPSPVDLFCKFESSPVFSRVGAYLILRAGAVVADDRRAIVGKILVQYPKDGALRLRVFVWDWTDQEKGCEIQTGSAGGYGYDKLDAALEGCTFAGVRIGTGDGQWKENLTARGFVVQGVV
jgi:hypothetical protein